MDANGAAKRLQKPRTVTTPGPALTLPPGLIGQLMWGKERSMGIWNELRALCLRWNLTGPIWHDMEELLQRIEAEDFYPFAGAQTPYNRVTGRIIDHFREANSGQPA